MALVAMPNGGTGRIVSNFFLAVSILKMDGGRADMFEVREAEGWSVRGRRW